MLFRRFFLHFLPLLAVLTARAADPAPLPPTTPWDLRSLARVPHPEWVDRTGHVRSLLYEGEPYKGHKTKVFAYYASPVTLGLEASDPKRKYPTVLLVHGGDGQAFSQWAQIYARHGYAALAMDLGGNWQRGPQTPAERLPDGGPPQDDPAKFPPSAAPDRDSWMYHAVADVILARSLLHIVPEADETRVGVLGLGWGGSVACIVAGLDPRFKAVVPVFGCGFLEANSAWRDRQFHDMTPEARKKWTQLWDPANYVGAARMAMFFVTCENDPYYPLDSAMKTYALVQSPKNLSVQSKLKHGPLFDLREGLLFFDAQLKDGPPPPRVASVVFDEGKLIVEAESKGALKSAELHFTTGAERDFKTRTWSARPLTIDGMHIRGGGPPGDATAWFVLIEDENDVLASSEVQFR